MNTGLNEHLATLQERLRLALAAARVPGLATDVVFVVAGAQWTLPSSCIARVALSSALLPVAPHDGMPPAVVGVVHSEGDVLTVVDAAALTGSAPTVVTSRSRLLSLSSDPLRGFALLVERVLDRVPAGSAREGTKDFDLNALKSAL